MRRVLLATFVFSAFVSSCADWDRLGCEAGDVSYCKAAGGGSAEGGGGGQLGGGAGGGSGGGGGEVDAGEMDAGTVDAGMMDAGTEDAGTRSDAGTDAGMTDAGSPDAGGPRLMVTPIYGREGDTIIINGPFSTATAVELVDSSNIRTGCTPWNQLAMGRVSCTLPSLPLGRYSISVSAGGTITEPDAFYSVGQPLIWFDATNSATVMLNSTTVSQLVDRGDGGVVLANATPSNQPVLRADDLQGHDTLGFNVQTNLVHNSLQMPVSGNGARVIALVGRFTSSSTSGWIFGYGGTNPFSIEQSSGSSIKINNGGGSLLTPPMFSMNIPFYFIVHCPGGAVPLTSCTIRSGADLVTPTTMGNAGSSSLNTQGNGLFLGKAPAASFTGDLSEVVFYGLLTGSEVDAVEQYLRAKYSL